MKRLTIHFPKDFSSYKYLLEYCIPIIHSHFHSLEVKIEIHLEVLNLNVKCHLSEIKNHIIKFISNADSINDEILNHLSSVSRGRIIDSILRVVVFHNVDNLP